MSLSPLIMTKTNPYCWALMPTFIETMKEFSAEHTAGGTDQCAERFECAFGAGINEMLGLAIVPDDEVGHLAGHVICGVETYLGQTACMVYQFSKESGTDADWFETNKAIQALIDNWCHGLGIVEIMAMAETKSRGRLFRSFGYTEGPVLMRRRFT
jgi:hypothetical protein